MQIYTKGVSVFNQLSRNIHSPGAAKSISSLLTDIRVVQMYGPVDAPVAGITSDSRRVAENWLFVATEGERTDGHNFIHQAIECGASAVVIQRKQYEEYLSHLLSPAYAQHTQTTVIVVENSRMAVGELVLAFYDNPAKKLTMIGITGTNGKTTTAYYIKTVLEHLGKKTGMLGTIEYSIGGEKRPALLTTPLVEDIQELLAEMVATDCETCVMEVSSHALALQRVYGISYDVALYTNLSRDHLDFHKTFEEYAKAKALLFTQHSRGLKIVNTDDLNQLTIWDVRNTDTMSYGVEGEPDLRIRDVNLNISGTTFSLDYNKHTYHIETGLVGSFAAMNATAAFAVCIGLGIEPEKIIKGIRQLENVPGRLERVSSRNGVYGFVDYSHTPDSLEKALLSLAEINKGTGRLIVVFGCGGDRDRGKRPLMGKVATAYADIAIVTADNPRTEKSLDIINDILQGVDKDCPVSVIPERSNAIKRAVEEAIKGDIILVAGKGHESYQIIGDERLYFSDVEQLQNAFNDNTEEEQA